MLGDKTIIYRDKEYLSSPSSSTTRGGKQSSVTMTVYNEYSTKNYTMFPYPFLDDAILLEPYRNSTIKLSKYNSACSYSWYMEGIGSLSAHSWNGSTDDMSSFQFEVNPPPTATGEYVIELSENCYGNSDLVKSQTVWVKYVRRELQSLTDNDREEVHGINFSAFLNSIMTRCFRPNYLRRIKILVLSYFCFFYVLFKTSFLLSFEYIYLHYAVPFMFTSPYSIVSFWTHCTHYGW